MRLVAGLALVLLATVWLPAMIWHLRGETYLARTWPLWKAAGKILAPSVVGARLVEQALHRLAGKQRPVLTEEELEEEIREVVSEGQREGLIEEVLVPKCIPFRTDF